MGTQVVSPQKMARYRRETGLPIVAAYAPAAHITQLLLEDGRMVWRHTDGTIKDSGDLWDADEPGRNLVSSYLARYLKKTGTTP